MFESLCKSHPVKMIDFFALFHDFNSTAERWLQQFSKVQLLGLVNPIVFDVLIPATGG